MQGGIGMRFEEPGFNNVIEHRYVSLCGTKTVELYLLYYSNCSKNDNNFQNKSLFISNLILF